MQVDLSLADSVTYPLDVYDHLTPWLAGISASTLLVGVLSVQIAHFVGQAQLGNETRVNQILVTVIAVFSFVSWVCQIRTLQAIFVDGFGQPAALEGHVPDLSLPIYIATTAKVFFGLRAWRLHAESFPLGGFLLVIIGAAWSFHLYAAASVGTHFREDLLQVIDSSKASLLLAYGTATLVDLVITGLIVARILRSGRGAGTHSEGVVRRIIQLALSTSFTTAASSFVIFCLVLASHSGASGLWIPFMLQLPPRLLACTCLFALNDKESLRGKFDAARGLGTSRGRSRKHHITADNATILLGGLGAQRDRFAGVKIDLETVRVVDGGHFVADATLEKKRGSQDSGTDEKQIEVDVLPPHGRSVRVQMPKIDVFGD